MVMLALRQMATQEVGVDRFAGRGRSSERQYEPEITVEGRVVREDNVVELPDGSLIRTQYTAYFTAEQPYLPTTHDRLRFTTQGEQRTAIVVTRSDRSHFQSTLVDHVRLQAREE